MDGIEPSRPKSADFKSIAFQPDFATPASFTYSIKNRAVFAFGLSVVLF